jgi:hypothetical protein
MLFASRADRHPFRRPLLRGIALPALAAFAAAGIACTTGSNTLEPEVEPPNALRVLFIGNSLTYTNDLPGVLDALADSAGVTRPIVVGAVAAPDYSLEDHWNDGAALEALTARAWDVVVLQQGPSSLPQNALHLANWTQRWATEIRAIEARPALYMVWPQRNGDFEAVGNAYREAARRVDGLLLPVGDAWREALRRDASTPLFLLDGFHPSPHGTYLAAVVMLGVLYDLEPVGLPRELRTPRGAVLRVPAADALALQEAAAYAIAALAGR